MTGLATGSFEAMPLTGPRSVSAIVANIFMLQGLAAARLSWNYPEWSISVEFLAYLAFPFALPLITRAPNAVKLVLGAFLFAALAWLAVFTRGHFDHGIVRSRCRAHAGILVGMLLYLHIPRLRAPILA